MQAAVKLHRRRRRESRLNRRQQGSLDPQQRSRIGQEVTEHTLLSPLPTQKKGTVSHQAWDRRPKTPTRRNHLFTLYTHPPFSRSVVLKVTSRYSTTVSESPEFVLNLASKSPGLSLGDVSKAKRTWRWRLNKSQVNPREKPWNDLSDSVTLSMRLGSFNNDWSKQLFVLQNNIEQTITHTHSDNDEMTDCAFLKYLSSNKCHKHWMTNTTCSWAFEWVVSNT